MLDVGILRVDRHRLPQQIGALLVHAAHPVEIRKAAESAVGAFGAHHELVVRSREGGDHDELLEPRIGEVPPHGGFCCLLHRKRVMRALPPLSLRGVALRADLAAQEAGRLLRLRCHGADKRQQDQDG